MRIVLRRAWCVSCKDFKIFEPTVGNESPSKLTCLDCNGEYQSTDHSEIPEEKLLEQRARYREKDVQEYVKLIFMASSLHNLPESDISLTEDDAGQKEINRKERAKQEELKKQWQTERAKLREEYATKFHSIGRNEKCACGSGNKYKRCCYKKYADAKHKYRF